MEAKVASLNFEQEIRLTQAAEHKLHMMRADTADAKQRSKALADSCQLAIQKWQTRVTEMEDKIKSAHQAGVDRAQQELIEKYLTEIQEKNRKISDFEQKRQQLNSQLLQEADPEQTADLQQQLNKLIEEFQQTVDFRVQIVEAMIAELEKLFTRHEALQNCQIDTERVKNAIDLAN